MTVFSSSYGIIMDRAMNAPGNGNNDVGILNTADKCYLKGEMEIIDKLASNDTTNNGMLPSASKDISIKFAYQCLHILNKKERLNGIKVSKKIQKRQSLFKYQ